MAESNQRTARAQKALKAQKAQSGAAKAKAMFYLSLSQISLLP